MTKRYYSAQYCDARAGWTDITDGFSLKKKKADRVAESFARSQLVATRVILKPHGWKPPESSEQDGPMSNHQFYPGVGSEARQARKLKNG